MTASELEEHLAHLQLGQPEASQLLGVNPRTLRRWLEGEEVPGLAEAALRAWRTLHDRNLPWKPDSVSLFEDNQHQIELHRRHTIEMEAVFKRVQKRGGPAHPWSVDLSKNSANFGPFEVGFYNLQSGSFSLSSYRRRDGAPDLARDMPFIEDAAYCISKAFEKARAGGPALKAVAQYTREHSSAFSYGPRMLSAEQKSRRRRNIEALADKLDQLAEAATNGKAGYVEFESILNKLHALGFFPQMSLISAVAKAL
jgi:uncharacterized protein (DUF2141 family)